MEVNKFDLVMTLFLLLMLGVIFGMLLGAAVS